MPFSPADFAIYYTFLLLSITFFRLFSFPTTASVSALQTEGGYSKSPKWGQLFF